MAEFHRLDDAVYDHGGAEASAQAEEKHLASLIATERLHGGIVDDFDGTSERSFEVESHPARPEIVGFQNRLAAEDRARIADRDRLAFPVFRRVANPGDHLLRRHR